MKKLFLITLIFFIALFSGENFSQVIGPKLKVSEKFYDFGKIEQGKIVKHNFVVYNVGDAPLKIIRLRSSCGCTVAHPSEKEIDPGEKLIITVKFNSGHYLGRQRKYVYLTTNDKTQPEFRFLLTGFVKEPESKKKSNPEKVGGAKLTFEQNRYNFGNVEKGKTVSVEIKFRNTGKANLVIEKVQTSCGCVIAATNRTILKPDEEGKLRIDLNARDLTGKIVRKVTIFSNDLMNSRQVITIFANVK